MFTKKFLKLFSKKLSRVKFNMTDVRLCSQSDHEMKVMAKGLPKKIPIEGVKNIIVISSAKGGVGKSTVSVNLALALKHINKSSKIGLLDSDIFGPSIPLLMNLKDTPHVNNKKMMIPLRNYGIQCMSMGFLIEEGTPVIWRGLMVMQALQKLIRQVHWEDIDYLIIDTPPGTGDTHLSLVQNLPLAGALLVTTPQVASLNVTRRGAAMFKKLSIPIIGILENMSSIVCPKCSANVSLFGTETAELAKVINCQILAKIPIEQAVSIGNDKGVPIVIAEPDHSISKSYERLAKTVIEFVGNDDINKEKID